MTEVSLSASIFGKNEGSEGALSSLFSSNATLPEKPNNLNFPETSLEKARRERNDEKKKKRKNRNDVKGGNTDETAKGDDDVVTKEIKSKAKKMKKTATGEKKEILNEAKDNSTANDEENAAIDSAEVGNDSSDDQEERTIFVGNLPLDTNRRSLESMFKDCGKIKSSRLRSFGTTGVKVAPDQAGNQNLVKKVSVNTKQFLEDSPKNTVQGYVVFEKVESVEEALKKNNQDVPNNKGLKLRVDRSKPTLDSSRSVFIGNLPYKASEMSLRTHFCNGCGWDDNDGIVEGVRIVRDKETLQCKGFGYVLLKDKSYVPQALEMHESKYMKREIRVLVCGKRFKNRQGAPKEGSIVTLSGAQRRLTGKTTLDKSKKSPKKTKDLITTKKDKKKRGTKKKTPVKKSGNAGISKRAATEKKLDKRAKKIQKRIQKGMGKTKK